MHASSRTALSFAPILRAAFFISLICQLLLPARPFAAVPGDEHWDNQFGPVGANDWVFGVASYRSNIYISGYFTAAGNTKAGLIAGFNGTNWFPLNGGISIGAFSGNFYAVALTAVGSNLYVGGNFTNVDNCGARACARWDGTNWYPMPTLPGYAFAFKSVGTDLYAGGIFVNTNSAYNCLARWTGTNWALIPGDFSGSFPVVNVIESDGDNLFIGGKFTGVAGVNSTNVVRWNGTSWSALGAGVGNQNGGVDTLLYKDSQLYAGGYFTNSAGILFTNTAVWNGSSWSAWANANREVRHLITDGTDIYAGGEFSLIGGTPASRIAKWDGFGWSALGAGLQGFGVGASLAVYRMAFGPDGRLYAGGNFNAVDGVGASHIAVWDGVSWSGLGAGQSKGLTHFIGNVSGFLVDGADLYVGGLFTEAGSQVVNSIARWDGTNWFTMNGGVTGTFTTGVAPAVRGMAFLGSILYVGGNFTSAGGSPMNGLAAWDGNTWMYFGDADATVRAVSNDGGLGLNNLYVGGQFTNIGGTYSPAFAVWNGNWSTLGILGGTSPNVNAIAVDGQDLYIGGSFTNIGAYAVTNLARWNWQDFQWHALGAGVRGSVASINASNGIVYVGGPFTVAGGVTVNRVAKWDGVNWSALGTGVAGSTSSTTVNNIMVRGTNIYITGTFTSAGGISNVLGLAKWDGTAWSGPIGSGLVGMSGTATAAAMAFIGNDFYVGGNFSWAGDKPSMFIARYNDQINFYPPANPQLINPKTLTNRQFGFRLVGTTGQPYIIQSSSNLTTWTPRLTNSATWYDYVDATASNAAVRVYRAVLQ